MAHLIINALKKLLINMHKIRIFFNLRYMLEEYLPEVPAVNVPHCLDEPRNSNAQQLRRSSRMSDCLKDFENVAWWWNSQQFPMWVHRERQSLSILPRLLPATVRVDRESSVLLEVLQYSWRAQGSLCSCPHSLAVAVGTGQVGRQ